MMSDMKDTASGTSERRSTSSDPPEERSVPNLLTFLTGVSRELAASTEYEKTLKTVAGQALPYLGSWCIVDIVEPDGSPRRLAIVHPDPKLQPHAERLAKSWPPERGDPLGLPRAVHTRRTEIIHEVDDETLVRVARSEENLRDLRKLGIGSIIVTPLLGRSDVLGAVTFVGAEAGSTYRESDLELAEDLAARCAIALENARLLQEVEEARELVVGMNERLVLSSLRDRDEAETATARKDSTSRFLAHVSHETRTPVNAILGYVELLADEVGGSLTETQRMHLERIRGSTRHLRELLADLLDLKKVEEGRMRFVIERVPLRPVVTEAVGMVGPLAVQAGVTVEHGDDESGDGHFYVGDEDRVRQILLNLLSNAVKFTDPGGKVHASWGIREVPDGVLPGEGPWAFVAVHDTGIGIPEGEEQTVFEAFEQLEGGRGRGQGGTGLGLPISRELARRMGGDVTVRSREGEGSCFTLWLPAAGDDG